MKLEIINNMKKHNKNLSKYACSDEDAIRLKESNDDFRPPFFKDADKILYSLSYIRYIDKTQVFTHPENDMVSRRMTHVQMVSKIARTIGRALNLNEDLIEAASLGHDLGHTPFGHVGESILNELSIKYGEGYFMHNIQSVRTLLYIEKNGNGSNISLQVLDAIMSHNGEKLEQKYIPKIKTKDIFFKEYNDSYKDKSIILNSSPMTLEGCVIKISDIIAYIGKDIDDAVRINKLKFENLPDDIVKVLGNNNSSIVNTLVCDIIDNSYNKNYISMSDKVFNALQKLINFNYINIYNKANTENDLKKYKFMFEKLFEAYINHITQKEKEKDIFKLFLNEMSDEYNNYTSTYRKIIDYMSGMTDEFFMKQFNKYIDVNTKK